MVMIGIDPHKDTHTALIEWATRFKDRRWAVEDCRHVLGQLERALLDHDERVVRVPPKLMGQTRRAERTWGKSDPVDATGVARAALREPALDQGRPAPATHQLRLLSDRRDDLVAERTREINRLRWLLLDLDPDLHVPARELSYGPAIRHVRTPRRLSSQPRGRHRPRDRGPHRAA